MLKSVVISLILAGVACSSAFAADAAAAVAAPASAASDAEAANKLAITDKQTELLDNLSVGIAVLALHKPEIVSATIEGGIVRVTEKRSMRPGFWLQTGYTWPSEKSKHLFYGFFVGAQVTESKLFNAVGIGPLVKVDRGVGKRPIFLGLGVQWSSMQMLGNGLKEDQAAPASVESIRYKQVTRPGLVVCFSMDLS
jgi:hypothetical protein